MMDKQKKESTPLSPPAARTNVFKIPKKKAEDWCEEVQASSPLTRLSNLEHRNVTVRKRPFSSSYESYNVPRNKETRAHYTSPASHRFPSTEHILGHHKEVEKETKASERRTSGEPKEQAQETPLSTVCRDVSNTPVSLPKNITFAVRKNGTEEGGTNVTKLANLEHKNSMKSNVVGSPNTREKTYCYKRAEYQNKKISPTNVSQPPSRDNIPSVSLESDADCLVKPSDLCIRDRVAITSRESKKSSFESCSVDSPMSSSQSNSKKKRHLHHTRKGKLPLEPIVLSSDEEDQEQEESVALGDEETLADTSAVMKEDDACNSPCPSPCNDVEPMDCSATLEDPLPPSENSVLQLKFLNVYFGKKKGRATGSVKVTPKSIEIPLIVPLDPRKCISLDTTKLQKYGLWLTSGGDAVRSSAIIILWITSDYISHIEKQMGTTSKNQASKSNELIFLELVEPLTATEQALLCKIMKEASKSGLPSLAESLTWSEMFSILDALSSEDYSFKANCGIPFKKQQQESSNTSRSADAPETLKGTSSFTLMQKCKDGHYSVSMVPKQHDLLKEVDKGGTLMRLLVYPPPPTKGGLAVTNEDLECLEHGQFLNDVIIDFYLKYLLLEKFPAHFAERCHIFSSFFFRCLTRKDNVRNDDNSEMPASQRRHHKVKTWTRHVDIFTKDFIFVPVNENCHWYLVVICFPSLEKTIYEEGKQPSAIQDIVKKDHFNSGSVIVFNEHLSKKEETIGEGSNSESEGSTSSGQSCNPKHFKHKDQHHGKLCKRPCLLIFDSLKIGSAQTTVQVLREYLKAEWAVKRKTPRDFSRSSMRDLYPKVPKQNNSTDCGLFVLQYVESFAQKPIESFEPPMHLENWFPASVVKNKRDKIRDLILQLHVQQSKKS
ncbi:sentrin-specific protease 7 isoform X2 [Eleutherodactylus coqui]|uniref:sentrin-specific protease 7 isoform X2 n=1 Tax=Eleutherodactylus coqui TaxID=57060 RepID=UPI0034622CE5